MKRFTIPSLLVLVILLVSSLAACDTAFQNNPHGTSYVAQLTPLATAPVIPTTGAASVPHLSPFGFGASLQAIAAQYGPPTKYSAPPLYAFQDGNDAWPKGSLVIVTIKENRAVEFSYVPGSDHPMTYQEAQDFAVKLLPDDVQGPKTVQPEDDHTGKCLARAYHSDLLKKTFPPNDFLSPDGKDSDPGSVTINLYPDGATNVYNQYITSGFWGTDNVIQNTSQVNSVLINLGSRPSC